MSEAERPQIYLITPPEFSLESFPAILGSVLDDHDVACVRLEMSSRDPDHVARAADAVRLVTHERDVALVVAEHVGMVGKLGLDGVHLPDGARTVRSARKALGPDAIVGAFCGDSRHDGMNAGEAGADYVSFGPVRSDGLGDGRIAERDLFEWWTEMIEVPVVAEGRLDHETVERLAPVTDFLGVGSEIWDAEDPGGQLARLLAVLG